MANYSIKKDNNNEEIVYMSGNIKGYDFSPKNSNKLKIDQIMIINKNATDKILTVKFKQRYKKLLMVVLSILNDSDSTEGDIMIALDEVAKMEDILLNKYKTFLKKEKERVFLEQLEGLRKSLQSRLQEIRNYEYYLNNELNNYHGR